MNNNKFFVDIPEEPQIEQPEQPKGFGAIKYIIIFIALAITIGIIYYAFSNKENNDSEPNKIHIEEENITITDELESELRSLIPSISTCNNVYYAKQYQDEKFSDSDIITSDLTTKSCTNLPNIYIKKRGHDSTTEFVYIYDQVLLFDNTTKKFGNTYNNYDIDYGLIELDIDENGKGYASDSSIYSFGKIYKYTFQKMDNDIYLYVSTEPYN